MGTGESTRTQNVENLFLGLRRNNTSWKKTSWPLHGRGSCADRLGIPTFTDLLLPVVRVTQDAGIKTTLVEREPVSVRFQPHRTIELSCLSLFCLDCNKTEALTMSSPCT